MSLLERIREAKRSLNNVETRVTFEDGSIACEKRASSGAFEYVEQSDDIEESTDETELCAEGGTYPGDGHSWGATIAAPVGIHSALSKRQLKKRLRRQRLGYVVDLKPDLQMANVADGVFLGSQDVAHDLDLLTTHKITHIINCATGVRNAFEGRIKYLNIDVLDLPSMNIAQYFDECHAFMRKCVEAGGSVLVHCNAGVSRSATIVLSYVMRYEKKSLKEALEQVNAVRRVSPNPGFMQQLLIYEGALKEENAE